MRETKNAKSRRLKVFISHSSKEADLARIIKQHLKSDFLGMVDSFVSTGSDIPAGQEWLKRIRAALNESQIVIVLCSKESVAEPWINFEAGAGWLIKNDIIPICHSGFRAGDLRGPLRVFQAIEASSKEGLEQLYTTLAEKIDTAIPRPNKKFINDVKRYETEHLARAESKEIAETSKEIRGIEQPNATETKELLTQFLKLIERLKREDKLTELIETGPSLKNPFQARVAAWRVSRTRAHVDFVRQREWELEAKTPTAYVAYVFGNVMDFLGLGDEYCTMTNPTFWSNRAVGDSAFLLKNVAAVQRGANIRRVFLIDDKKMGDTTARDDVAAILQAHEEASREANSAGKGVMEVRCLFSSNFHRDFDFYRHFGLARHLVGRQQRDDGALVIVPRYASTIPGTAITHLKLIFSDGPSTETSTIEFASKFDKGMHDSIDLAAAFRKLRRRR